MPLCCISSHHLLRNLAVSAKLPGLTASRIRHNSIPWWWLVSTRLCTALFHPKKRVSFLASRHGFLPHSGHFRGRFVFEGHREEESHILLQNTQLDKQHSPQNHRHGLQVAENYGIGRCCTWRRFFRRARGRGSRLGLREHLVAQVPWNLPTLNPSVAAP